MSLILSGTDGLSDVDGTAATPAIRGTDTNTGIFFPAADTIAFAEGGVEAARFDSAGNLGLGVTPSGTSKFEVYTGNNAINGVTSRFNGSNAPIALASTTSNGFPYVGWNTVQVLNSDNQTYAVTGVASRLDANNGGFKFNVAASGTAGNTISFTEAMTLNTSGNLGVGTTSPSSRLSVAGNITLLTASPTISTALNDYLDIKATNAGGAVRIYSGNSLAIQCNSAQVITMPNLAGAGTRAVNANAAGELSAASDSRLKQEVEGQTLPSLAEVMKLEVKAYKWLDDINLRGDEAAVEIGFFADQVAPIIPSAAPMGRDGYYGFYDRSVIAALVNAIKEQQALITQLTARITALETA